jgi:hypothetical protein
MALPSGTFNNASSGRLQVTFRGKWTTNSGADWGAGTLNLILRAYVGSGGSAKTAILSILANTAVIEVPYTGGTDVAVGLEYVTHSFSGPSSIAARELECVCRLFAS